MLIFKTVLDHTARRLLLVLAAPLLLPACEIQVGSAGDDEFDDEYVDSSAGGVVWRVPPRAGDDYYDDDLQDEDDHDEAVNREPEWEGPGITSYTELIVLDPQLLGGAYADNGNPSSAWSFRRQMAWLAGGDAGALDFSARWLSAWHRQSNIGASQAPVAPRPDLGGILLYPWLGEGSAPA